MLYRIKPGCEYSRFGINSPWHSFYHDDHYQSGSGPSKHTQKLALWYVHNDHHYHLDWLWVDLLQNIHHKNMVMNHYPCTEHEAEQACQYIHQFIHDVEHNFVVVSNPLPCPYQVPKPRTLALPTSLELEHHDQFSNLHMTTTMTNPNFFSYQKKRA